jgi:NADPH:quinone reductase-like Zn-dependent oxidoreductase
MRNSKVLRWTAKALALLLALGVAALFIAYWRSDNDCEERRATAPKNPMKAVFHCEYGGPELLKLENAEKPTPRDDQVLIRVRAVAVNPLDVHVMRGKPYAMRLMGMGLRKPADPYIGVDFSGVVEAAGKNAKQFHPGDEVFGGILEGAFAEYIVVSEGRIAKKPANISFEEAAGVNVGGRTALQALRDYGKVQPGQKVLINGASGGVGTFAVQIAKHLGAEVTGVSSGRNTELVRSLGADHTIDYTQRDYTQGAERYDVIVDNVGNHSFSENRRVLKPTGRYIMVSAPKGRWIAPMDKLAAIWVYAKFVVQEFRFMLTQGGQEDLRYLADLMQQGKVKTVIDRTYKLSEIAEAMRYLETGRARAKIVLQVE